jgi:hypothetical protein
MSIRGRIALALAIATTAGMATAPGAGAAVLAENGFTSAGNGYSFQNFGPQDADGGPIADLGPAQMKKLFGSRVCANGGDGACVLTPEAETWMDSTNASMAGGHCFGMATTAQLWFQGQGKPPAPDVFGSPTVPGLGLPGNVPLQRHIAYAWTLQTLPAVAPAEGVRTPNDVVRELRAALEPGVARYVLTIFDDGEGHAITPIAVENTGGGMRRIAVYDNNWPGQTRYVEVDTKADTWSYGLAPNLTWQGTAQTQSLQLVDPRPGLGHQPCFICPASGKARTPGKTVELRVTADPKNGRHGSLTVTDGSGRSSGCGPSGCFNEIRGAELRRIASVAPPWKTAAPPVLTLPTRSAYSVALGATSKEGQVAEGVNVIGRGFSVGASNVQIRKGEQDRIKIRRDVAGVTYKNDARGTEAPTLELTSSNNSGPSVKIEVEPAGIDPRARVDVRFDPRGKLRLTNREGERNERVKLTFSEYSAKGQRGTTTTLKLRRGQGRTVRF